MRVLVIDDDELSRELLATLIGVEGHAVQVAASGEEALAVLCGDREAADVILSDMQMPGISGEALARALREAAGAKTQLLAMSGSQPAQAALRGFDGFLLKPFSMEDLEALIVSTQREPKTSAGKASVGTASQIAEIDVPELNEEVYAKMAKMMAGAQLGELYGMCLADTRRRLAHMGELAEAQDDNGFREAAHTVKGGCGMIGATELYHLAELAERDGLTGRSAAEPSHAAGTGASTALLERFSSACDRLERILNERR